MGDNVVDRALEVGVKYFRAEKYGKARELFLKAIELAKSQNKSELIELRRAYGLSDHCLHDKRLFHHPKLAKLYDNVSACWEKSGHLEKALSYSKKTIQIDPYRMGGYLRSGKILQLQHKDKEAYGCYKKGLAMSVEASQKYGLKSSDKLVESLNQQRSRLKMRLLASSENVSETNSNSNQNKRIAIDPIEEQRSKLARSASSLINKNVDDKTVVKIDESISKPVDFIARLPLEILKLIFQDFAVKDLLKCLTVSKLWKERILSQQQLFKKFELNSCTNRKLNKFKVFLQTIIRRYHTSRPILESLRFSSKLASEEFNSLKTILSYTITISFKRIILSIPNTTIGQLRKVVSDSNLQNLIELSLVISLRSDKDYEIDLISKCQHLKKLELIFVKSVIPINGVNVIDANGNRYENYCRDVFENLESIKLICDQIKVNSCPLQFGSINYSWSSMKKLVVSGVTLFQSQNELQWLIYFPNLEELWLENNKNAKLQSMISLFKSEVVFKNLKKLTFREFIIGPRVDIGDIDRGSYIENFRNLEELDLMGSSIGGDAIINILSCNPQNSLKSINIGDCMHVKLSSSTSGTDMRMFSLPHFSALAPNLQKLSLPQLGSLNDSSLLSLSKTLENFKNLLVIDISFNPSISGAAVYELVKVLNHTNKVPLETLIINGCPEISHITAAAIQSKRLVLNMECNYESKQWKKFGINSYQFKS